MKKLLLFIVGFVVIGFVGVLVVGLLSLNSLIEGIKPDLEKMASQGLGTDVQLGEIQASVFPSASLRVLSVKVGPKEGADQLELKDLSLHVRLLPLLSKKLEISSVVLRSPSLTLIKDERGMRIAGLPEKRKKKRGAGVDEAGSNAQEKSEAPTSDTGSPIALALDELIIEDGTLVIDDRVSGARHPIKSLKVRAAISMEGARVLLPSAEATGVALESLGLGIKVSEARIEDSIVNAPKFSVSIGKNTLSGSLMYDLKRKEGEATFLTKSFDVSELAPAFILAPQLKDLQPSGKFSFDLKAILGPKNRYKSEGSLSLESLSGVHTNFKISDITGNVQSTAIADKATFASKDLSLSFNGKPVQIAFTGELQPQKTLNLAPIDATLFGGKAVISTSIGLVDPRPLSTTFNLTGISATEALSAIGTPEAQQKFSATVEKAEGQIQGSLGSSNVAQSLAGTMNLVLKNAEIKNFNLVGNVLNSVKGLPFMKGALMDAVPTDQKGAVQSTDTVLDTITGTFKISSGKITTSDFLATSALFTLEGAGSIGFDGMIDLTTTIRFTKEFSEGLAKSAKELRALFDDEKRLIIPLALKGKTPDIAVLPNVEKLLKTAGGKLLQDKAADFLERTLGGKKDGSGSSKKGLEGLLGF